MARRGEGTEYREQRWKGKGEWCAIGYAADKAKLQILERHSISL